MSWYKKIIPIFLLPTEAECENNFKYEAHDVFDLIWEKHFMKRAQAYTWLSKQLGTERDYTHTGMFDVETCKKVIVVSNKYLIERGSIMKSLQHIQQ